MIQPQGERAGWTASMVALWNELQAWHTANARPELACGFLLHAGGQCGVRPAVEVAGEVLCWGHYVDEEWQGPACCRDCGDGLTADELERPDRRCGPCAAAAGGAE